MRTVLIKRLSLAVAATVVMLCTFFAGAFYGYHSFLTFQEMEVTGNLNSLVDYHVLLKDGEVERVSELVEGRIAAAVASLPHSRSWTEIPDPQKRSLLVTKKYFEAVPPEGESARDLIQALAGVPDEPVDWESCRPLARRFMPR